MSIHIELSPDEERRLAERASLRGQGLAEYAHEILSKHARLLAGSPDELLAPVRAEFRDSGMTEEELDALVEEAREEVWRERHGGMGHGEPDE